MYGREPQHKALEQIYIVIRLQQILAVELKQDLIILLLIILLEQSSRDHHK